MKFPTNPDYQEKIRTTKNPVMVKRMGRGKGCREDWAEVKNDVMFKALQAKFSFA